MQDSGVDDANNVPYLETHFETYIEQQIMLLKRIPYQSPDPKEDLYRPLEIDK